LRRGGEEREMKESGGEERVMNGKGWQIAGRNKRKEEKRREEKGGGQRGGKDKVIITLKSVHLRSFKII
jgi:hypothetical protein